MRRPTLIDLVLAELDDGDALDRFADKLAPLIAARLQAAPTVDGWLDARRAAGYLACDRERVYDLVQTGKLVPRRDGRRLLFRRLDLDAYLESVD